MDAERLEQIEGLHQNDNKTCFAQSDKTALPSFPRLVYLTEADGIASLNPLILDLASYST